MDHSQSGEVAVLGAERAVQDVNVIHQFRSQTFQLAQIALPVSPRVLVLLDIVHQHFQSAVYSPMIQIEDDPARVN